MTFTDRLNESRSQLRELGQAIPAAVKGFNALQKGAQEGGALSNKEMEFVALGISIAIRCEPCILFHVEALMKAGATREEIADVCAASVTMGGGPSLMYAGKALAVFDEFVAAG